MAQFVKHFVQDLTQDIKIRQCGTIVFNKDNLSNVITVDLYNGQEEYSGGGSVAGACICPDGSTVPLTGSIDGKTASVTLTGDCFAFPGQIGIGIQVVSGTVKTTVLKAIYNVELFETDDVIDPGSRITASVGDLVQDITDAIATIPADLTDLLAAIAPTFSTSTAYATGQYVWYDGKLYRFTAGHAAGSWTGTPPTDAAVINLSGDVSASARQLEYLPEGIKGVVGAKPIIFEKGKYYFTADSGNAVYKATSLSYACGKISVTPGDVITINGYGGAGRQRLYVWLDVNGNSLGYYTGSGRKEDMEVTVPTSPSGIAGVAINTNTANYPEGYYAYVGTTVDQRLATKQDTLTFDTAPTENSANPVTSAGIKTAIDASGLNDRQLMHDSIVYGGVAYWPVSPASGTTSTSFSVTQSGAYILVDGTHGTSVGYAKLDKTFAIGNGNTTTGPTNAAACAKDTKLKAGYNYKFDTQVLSGTYTGGVSSSKCVIRIYDSTSTLLSEFAVGTSFSISPQTDTVISIIFYSYGANNVYSDYKVMIRLEEFQTDTSPIEDSKNPIASGAVYNIVQSLPMDETIPAYYFENDYLKNKLDAITYRQNNMSVKNDAFWLISDYHDNHNEGHSLALLKYLMKRTGITKLIYAGDAGGSQGSSEYAVYHRIQDSAKVWADMDSITKEFYGVIGNHEWINSDYGKLSGMMAAYLNRYKVTTVMDENTGSYYVDNAANKIRMFFLQDASGAYPISGTIDWFKQRLLEVPADYSIMVTMHYGYVPNTVTNASFNGYNPPYVNHPSIAKVSKLLHGCRHKDDMTSEFNVDFRELSGERHIIGIFSGHIHHGFLYTEGTETGIENIAVFEASTDSLLGGLQQLSIHGHPWYWQDDIVGGTQIERTAGTINEQCFYCVQIDMDSHMLYITTIGGDNNYSGCYQPASDVAPT